MNTGKGEEAAAQKHC